MPFDKRLTLFSTTVSIRLETTRCSPVCHDASASFGLRQNLAALHRSLPHFSAFMLAQLQLCFRARSLCASSLVLRLTWRSTGHFAACGRWASFHFRPTAACRKMPVSFNVRPHSKHFATRTKNAKSPDRFHNHLCFCYKRRRRLLYRLQG